MLALNYVYFLIITCVGVKYLFSKRVTMTNPLQRGTVLEMNGREAFWVLTFGTGLLAFSAPGALDLMAVRLLVLEIMLIGGLTMADQRPVWSFPLVMYVVFLAWIVYGCFYSPAPMYGVRVVLKYIYPVVVALFASAVVRNTEIFIKAGVTARWVAIISIIVFFTSLRKVFPGVFWYGTAAAINYISIMIFSLALFFYTDERRKNLFYAVLFIVPCFLWVFRTSIMGNALALMFFALFKYKVKSLPIILGFLLLVIASIFMVPSVKKKMFNKEDEVSVSQLQSGEISKDDIDSNGRFAMWEWSMDNFYKNKEITGTGTGNLQETFYALRHPFARIRIVHSDYVQILCDNGVVGIVLFGASFLLMICHCFMVYNNKCNDIGVRLCAIVAGTAIPGVLLTMMTDNVINYSMATISYPCGFYGMMLGLLKGQNKRK